jgi:putative ABC transport system ATP-binding protein
VTQLNEDQLDHLRNRKLGFIFQSFNLIPVLSAYENIELPLLIQNDINDKERKERVLEALNDVDILKFKDHKPDKLSGGQRQRAAIARCLVTHPSIILADEPTANLDSKTAHMVIDLLIDLNKKKKVTFLFCTHDEKLIGRVGRIIKIQDGLITS